MNDEWFLIFMLFFVNGHSWRDNKVGEVLASHSANLDSILNSQYSSPSLPEVIPGA